MSISRRMTSFSFASSSAGSVACCMMSQRMSMADARAGVRHVDVIDRAVEARVGVHVTAGFLHFLIDAAAGARGGAFEKHVFEHVRKARAEPFAFMNAARHAPRLRRNHRRAVILAHDDRQSVFERGERYARRNGRNAGSIRIQR